jgi:5-oxoprolinase (ATP-hydrolysing)
LGTDAAHPPWQLWIDAGGTFTDCVGVAPDGEHHRVKVLSSSALRSRVVALEEPTLLRIAPLGTLPEDFFRGFRLEILGSTFPAIEVLGSSEGGQTLRLAAPLSFTSAGAGCELRSTEEAAVLGARVLTRTPPHRPLPPILMRLATTRGTNALLERTGAPPVLFITRGFADLLLIGTQQRPDLFALEIVKPEPLYGSVVEVDERLDADGNVLTAFDPESLRSTAEELRAGGSEVAAVALLHSYRNPCHEEQLGALLLSVGFRFVALSAELAPLIKLLPRAETAVVEAYLSPVLEDYLGSVGRTLAAGGGTLQVMTSAGGLVRAADFRCKDGLLSGPAGGVVGSARAGQRSGLSRVIAFDMGGTSTDVARFDGDFEYQFEHRVGGAHLVAPALAIESVAAGGGSICSFQGGRLRVGPESAGADPGPACYGAGGPLTITDVNLLLGRLEPERFAIPVVPAASERALAVLLAELAQAGESVAPESVLEGLLEIANERMAEAIRSISLGRGEDPGQYALVAFGGAGAQHACAVASLLDMRTVLVPPEAGLLSAFGLGAAVIERFAERQVLASLSAVESDLPRWSEELGARALAAVAAETGGEALIRRRILQLRFSGQQATLPVELIQGEDPARGFLTAYRAHYGYEPEGRDIEVESLRVVASSPVSEVQAAASPGRHAMTPAADLNRRRRMGGAWRDVPALDRDELTAGAVVSGPALIFERHTATVVEEGWEAWLDGAQALVLRPQAEGRH